MIHIHGLKAYTTHYMHAPCKRVCESYLPLLQKALQRSVVSKNTTASRTYSNQHQHYHFSSSGISYYWCTAVLDFVVGRMRRIYLPNELQPSPGSRSSSGTKLLPFHVKRFWSLSSVDLMDHPKLSMTHTARIYYMLQTTRASRIDGLDREKKRLRTY